VIFAIPLLEINVEGLQYYNGNWLASWIRVRTLVLYYEQSLGEYTTYEIYSDIIPGTNPATQFISGWVSYSQWYSKALEYCANYYNWSFGSIVREDNNINVNLVYDQVHYNVIEKYYSFAIPIYENTYKYIDLIKTILFLNNVTIYSGTDGTVTFQERTFDFKDSATPIIVDRSYLIKPFAINATERDDMEIDVLSIIYYTEDGYVGPNGEFLDAYMKQKYQTIFERIPSDISFKLKVNNILGTPFVITPQCLIKTTDDMGRTLYVVVTQYGPDKNNFVYDIKGYIYKGSVYGVHQCE